MWEIKVHHAYKHYVYTTNISPTGMRATLPSPMRAYPTSGNAVETSRGDVASRSHCSCNHSVSETLAG